MLNVEGKTESRSRKSEVGNLGTLAAFLYQPYQLFNPINLLTR